MADTKEALPVVAWSYVPSAAWADVVYTYDPEKVKLAREYGCEVTQLTDHATATAAIAELRAEVERALGAMADIANSDDMTLEVAQNKARRVYAEIRAAHAGASGGAKA